MANLSGWVVKIICPKCNARDSFAITYREKEWIRYCNAKGCDYKEAISTDAWIENL